MHSRWAKRQKLSGLIAEVFLTKFLQCCYFYLSVNLTKAVGEANDIKTLKKGNNLEYAN